MIDVNMQLDQAAWDILPILKALAIWIELKLYSGEPKSICRVGRFTGGSLQLSNFGENKLVSGFNCTGFCVLVDCELFKCSAIQQMVSGFHEQTAEAAVLGSMVIKAAAVQDKPVVSRKKAKKPLCWSTRPA